MYIVQYNVLEIQVTALQRRALATAFATMRQYRQAKQLSLVALTSLFKYCHVVVMKNFNQNDELVKL